MEGKRDRGKGGGRREGDMGTKGVETYLQCGAMLVEQRLVGAGGEGGRRGTGGVTRPETVAR